MFTLSTRGFCNTDWESGSLERFFHHGVLLEKIDRGRVNGLGCDFYYINLATNSRHRGVSHGPVYGRVKITFPYGS